MLENLDDIWRDDPLNRRHDAELLEVFLRHRSFEIAQRKISKSYVLNLDTSWGEGKTFFLTNWRRQLEAHGHLAVYIDAWRHDFADDPLIAVMAAIDEAMDSVRIEEPVHNHWRKVKRAVLPILKAGLYGALLRGGQLIFTSAGTEALIAAARAAGYAEPEAEADASQTPDGENALSTTAESLVEASAKKVDDAVDSLSEQNSLEAIAGFRTARKSLEQFCSALEVFIAELETNAGKAMPLFVLIDELDRCRPTYAITMLERVKHLFRTRNVVFVIATDTEQLAHSVGATYGSRFDASRYLHRFFDRTYTFEPLSRNSFVEQLMQRWPLDCDKIAAPDDGDPSAFVTAYSQGPTSICAQSSKFTTSSGPP
jgi:hypothetical protein